MSILCEERDLIVAKKVKAFIGRFIWCLPVLFMFIGSLYFLNLFQRMYDRDLMRQTDEKQQLATFIESIETKRGVVDASNIIDKFSDTHTYILTEDFERIVSKYHTSNCPFKTTPHPYEVANIKDKMTETKRGFFEYSVEGTGKIYWDYRWVDVENEKLLIVVGVSNYPLDPIDKELQIAVGFLLLLTAVFNWILVGYAKYLRNNRRNK